MWSGVKGTMTFGMMSYGLVGQLNIALRGGEGGYNIF